MAFDISELQLAMKSACGRPSPCTVLMSTSQVSGTVIADCADMIASALRNCASSVVLAPLLSSSPRLNVPMRRPRAAHAINATYSRTPTRLNVEYQTHTRPTPSRVG